MKSRGTGFSFMDFLSKILYIKAVLWFNHSRQQSITQVLAHSPQVIIGERSKNLKRELSGKEKAKREIHMLIPIIRQMISHSQENRSHQA